MELFERQLHGARKIVKIVKKFGVWEILLIFANRKITSRI